MCVRAQLSGGDFQHSGLVFFFLICSIFIIGVQGGKADEWASILPGNGLIVMSEQIMYWVGRGSGCWGENTGVGRERNQDRISKKLGVYLC